jgi:4-azaleucine resistance transporter AzlC
VKSREFFAGAKDMLPLLLGAAPFGLAYGIVGVTVGLTPGETVLMSLLVFAGAAQFISLAMFADAAGLFAISFTTLLINLRHLLMGASLAPHMAPLSLPFKALLTFGLTDESYAVTIARIRARNYCPDYQLGANMSMYLVWNLSTLVGVALGNSIPDPLSWGVDFAMPVTFLALLLPRLKDRTSVTVCVVAALISVSSMLLIPGKWYIIIATIAAIGVGSLMEKGDEDVAG